MNAERYLLPGAIVPVTNQTVADLVDLAKQQADRIAELEKEVEDWEKATKWMEMTRQVPTKPLSDEEIPYLHILQNAHTVPLGSEIWQSDEELQKYKKIIVSTVREMEAKLRGEK